MKRFKTVIIFSFLAALVIGYYLYLSNRTPKPKEAPVAVAEVNDIINMKIETNYPDTPRELVNLYCRIVKAYYKTKLSELQVEKLGTKAWGLFDSDLQNACISLDNYIVSLKDDIKAWNKEGMYVNEYVVESNSDIDYVSYAGGKQAAIVRVEFYVRKGSNLIPTVHEFYVGKNSNGRWKILSWHIPKQEGEETDNDI